MKTGLRATASVVLGVLLWFILYLAFAYICILALAAFPTAADLIDWGVRSIHAEHLYAILFMGIPAIVPAIVVKQIMKGTSEKAQKWTLIALIAALAIFIIALNTDALSLLEKLEGILGVGFAFWAFGKEDFGNTYHVSKKSMIIVLVVVAAICVVIHVSQHEDIRSAWTSIKTNEVAETEDPQPARSNSQTYKVAGVTFNDPNGTSRQQTLADLMATYGEGKDIPCRLVEYEYLGQPAFYVYVGTKIIGNIPADAVAEVKNLLTEFEDTSVQIGKFAPDGETLYYARVTIEDKAESIEETSANITKLVVSILSLIIIGFIVLAFYIKTHPNHPAFLRFVLVSGIWVGVYFVLNICLMFFFSIKFGYLIGLLFYYAGRKHYNWIADQAELERT